MAIMPDGNYACFSVKKKQKDFNGLNEIQFDFFSR